MIQEWLWAPWRAIGLVIVSTVAVWVSLVAFTRVAGLRSFSKMSGFDFAVTVAIGSLLATVLLTEDPPLVQGVVGLATLFAVQMGAAHARRRFSTVRGLVDNEPVLLMRGTEILEGNLSRAGVTRADLFGKLREANVTRLEQVRAVVLETTGDVSVLHEDPSNPPVEEALLEGVEGDGLQ